MRNFFLTMLISLSFQVLAQSTLSGNHGPSSNDLQEPDWVNNSSTPISNEGSKTRWTSSPFDHQVFIENKGQFDADVNSENKILFQAKLGDVNAYFTSSGVIYKYIKLPEKKTKGEDADDDRSSQTKSETCYTSYTWNGASRNVTVTADIEQTYFYAYPTGPTSSIKVNVFKKIIYHNLYPGVDCEYCFIKGKAGLKYSLIVHAGANLSLVKLKYNGTSGLKERSGDILVQSDIGEIIDHAPASYFQKSGRHVKSSYTITNLNEESFFVNAIIDSSDNLVIDPWSWSSTFTPAYNAAYDVDYDNAGNVYAYGSFEPFQLVKINAAGIQQWVFNASTIDSAYGDFAVDKVTGTSYIVEGANNKTGARALKVSTNDVLEGTFPGTKAMYEMWRAEYNSCTRQIVIGGGGANTPNTQACILDTDMSTFTPVNPLGAVDGYHDVCLIAMDPVMNKAYMAVAASQTSPNFNNILMSVPVPALTPSSYQVPDKFGFLEIGSVAYFQGTTTPNGMNGMAASPNWLYMYDGDTLKKVNKATGAIIANKQVSGLGAFQFGGLDADACDNAYVGVNKTVQVYSSALALTSTIPLKSIVYDVVLGANDQIIYTAENGYVEAINLATPPSVTITNSITPTSCSKCNGSATPTLLLCGSAPVTTPTYLWSPGGQTTQTATNLCVGNYTVTISLGCGQVYVDTLTVKASVPPALTVTTTQTNEKCFGNTTGSAIVNVTSGTSPYTYTWVPSGGTNATASNLAAGTYTVRVMDAACQKDSAIVTITQPMILKDSVAATTNVNCFGGSNGTATAGVKGGTIPYSYSWNSTPVQTTAKATGLPVGSYTVNITDAHGCTGTANTTITQPTQLRDSIVSTTPVTCPGSTNGTATAGAKNGTPGYTYSWNTSPVQTTATASNLAAGSYTCTVTDANGCSGMAIATITSLSSMRDSIVSTVNELCFGATTGSATGGVKGGTPPYSYSWSTAPVQTTTTASNLAAGSYTFTVTDANSCTVSAVATITQPSKVRDSISTSNNVLCFGGNTGGATVGVKNGTPGYTYSWNTTPIQTNATVTGLSIGSYNCVVTDANGCISSVNVIIVQPSQLTMRAAAFPVTCFGLCNGSATALPKGGTTPYSYSWNTVPPATNPNVTGLCAGNYSVQVTDANGCVVDSTPITVTQPTAISITKTGTVSAHCGQPDGSGGISVTGGNPPYSYKWSNSTSSTTANLNNVTPGSYCVTVTDANSCTDTACIVINDIPGETVTIISTTNDTCNGGADGTATAGVTGNVGPYTYSWNTTPPQTTQTATGLKAGNYTVTVTDSVGCISTAFATISQPSIVITTTNVPPPICIGQPTTINASSVGGTAPYTYSWSNGATGSSITVSPPVTTTYSVTTVDAYGCSGNPVTTVVVIVDQPLSVTTVSPVAICPGGTATLTAKGSGGDGNYVYTWAPGNTTGSSIQVTPGTNSEYTVTLSDNCETFTVKDSVQVLIDPTPVVKFTSDTALGCPGQCIKFTDGSTVAGGIKSWLWTFGNGATSTSQNPTYCFDSAGIFTVSLSVVSDSGCKGVLAIPKFVTIYSDPVAAFDYTPQSTSNVDPLITFTNESTDLYGITKYLWKFNEEPYNAEATVKDTSYAYHDTGTFCPILYVTNKHRCVDSVQHCVVITPYFTLYIPNAFSPNGDGKNDIFAPKANFVCAFQMYIFDRWGMLLYYTEDMSHGWDGTVNGGTNYVQEDTYIYIIKVVDCVQHNNHSYLGKVTVVN